MGDDGGGAQWILQPGCGSQLDSHSSFDPPTHHDQMIKSEHERGVVMEKGPEVIHIDMRNRDFTSRLRRSPAFAWNALEAMSVRSLFRVTPTNLDPIQGGASEDAFVKPGSDALLTAVGDEQKLVTIVLAFQRWRHIQLKTILGHELKKVLDEAREDEADLAALESELEHMEQQLASARANSSRLRSQLAVKMSTSDEEKAGHSADDTTVSKSGREVMRTMEGLKEAETQIQRRDDQIKKLKERLQCMEDRFEGQLSRLQAEKSNLQAENSSAVRENKALLEQLSSKDKEVIKQVEEMERLKALAARLVEQHSSKQQQIESIMAEHRAEVRALQEQLRQAKCSREIDLATTMEHCSHLKQEKHILLVQLQEAERRADLASARAEDLCIKLQCTTDDRAKASEAVASEMVKHLKKLTDHVRKLETTVHATDSSQQHTDGSNAWRKMESTKLGSCAEEAGTPELDQVYYNFSTTALNNFPLCPPCITGNAQDQRHVSFSSASGHNLLHHVPQHRIQIQIGSWITWKWRWAASTARAEILAKKLHGVNQDAPGDSHLERRQLKMHELRERLRTRTLTTCMENELNTMVADHKLVPLILSAWQAFTRTSSLELKSISRSALLDKMLEALPWWIRRIGDRRQLERSFFQWQVLALSADRQSHSKQDRSSKSNGCKVVEEPPNYEIEEQMPAIKLLNRVTHFDQGLLRHSDENNADSATQRRAPKPHPDSPSHQKRTFGENSSTDKVSIGSQCRALQALQTTLQQEVTELQKILCQEIQPLQHTKSQSKGRPATAPTTNSYEKDHHPDGKKLLKSVLGVCNNLKLALTNVRDKLSPNVLADTIITCSQNERTKLSKGLSGTWLSEETVRRRNVVLNGQSPRSSPRRGSTPGRSGKSRNSEAVESWGTQRTVPPPGQIYFYSCTRPTNFNPAQDSRERIAQQGGEEKYYKSPPSLASANSLKDQGKELRHQTLQGSRSSGPEAALVERGPQKLCSRYESPFRSQVSGTATPKTKKASPRTYVTNTSRKDRSNTTASPLAPQQVQEIKKFKHGLLQDKRSPRGTNPALSMSVIKRLLEEGATNASPEEKKLIGSAFAQLLGSKLSKLRGGQAA